MRACVRGSERVYCGVGMEVVVDCRACFFFSFKKTQPSNTNQHKTKTDPPQQTQAAIEARLKEEDAERFALKAEREAERAQNILEHRDEILQRPKREWFQVRCGVG